MVQAAKVGDLKELETVWNSSQHGFESTTERKETVKKLACVAIQHSHSDVLVWCFRNGFTLPRKSLNDKFYHSLCYSKSTSILDLLVCYYDLDLNNHSSELHGDALLVAARDSDVEFARALLDHGHNPNTHSTVFLGHTEAITWAITSFSIEMVKLLLERGTELPGTGAVIAAAEVGNMDALKLLIGSNEGFLERQSGGREGRRSVDLEEAVCWWEPWDEEPEESVGTALYRACRMGQVEAAELLLNQGANGFAIDKACMSCLDIAKERGLTDVVKLLESRGITV
ncbi:MAG: hypothetical protein M1831_005979 [Alyxoria varia]|nr:MAG: hypothetical protein M1831_005979 [Alyxoria varia]